MTTAFPGRRRPGVPRQRHQVRASEQGEFNDIHRCAGGNHASRQPDWYPDPSSQDHEVYWDGDGWHGHREAREVLRSAGPTQNDLRAKSNDFIGKLRDVERFRPGPSGGDRGREIPQREPRRPFTDDGVVGDRSAQGQEHHSSSADRRSRASRWRDQLSQRPEQQVPLVTNTVTRNKLPAASSRSSTTCNRPRSSR